MWTVGCDVERKLRVNRCARWPEKSTSLPQRFPTRPTALWDTAGRLVSEGSQET